MCYISVLFLILFFFWSPPWSALACDNLNYWSPSCGVHLSNSHVRILLDVLGAKNICAERINKRIKGWNQGGTEKREMSISLICYELRGMWRRLEARSCVFGREWWCFFLESCEFSADWQKLVENPPILHLHPFTRPDSLCLFPLFCTPACLTQSSDSIFILTYPPISLLRHTHTHKRTHTHRNMFS